MYAVFETGGKQYKAEQGEIVFVEKLAMEPGKTVSFDALVVADGDDVKIGTPIVEGVKVRAKVIEHGKEKKVVVFKYKPKRDYRKKQGHRQPFTKIKILGIGEQKDVDEKKPAAKPDAKPAAKTAAKPAAKTAAKPAAKTAAKPAAKTAAKPAAKKPAAKSTATKTEKK